VDLRRLNANFSTLVSQALGDLQAAGFKSEEIEIIRSVDARYRYQVHELNVPFRPGADEIKAQEMGEIYAGFDELYEKSYGQGSAYREAGKEIITFRVSGIGRLRKPEIERSKPGKTDPARALKGKRDVYFEEHGKFVATRIFDFDRLEPGADIPGPAIIETPVTTIVVNPNDRATMDELRNVIISIQTA
jgi:N-methylhydantoinase A